MNIATRCLQAALLGSALQVPLQATAGSQGASIDRIAINKNRGAIAFIRLTIPPDSPAGCSTDSYWHFTVPLITDLDKQVFSLLLGAKASGGTAYIYGNNVCNDIGNVESVYAVSVQ